MKCPFCQSELEEKDEKEYVCEVCGKSWKRRNGELTEIKKRPRELAMLFSILIFILIANITIATIEYISDPRICTLCHGMEKYFESWNESTHRGIKCYECHFGQGPINFLRGTYHSLYVLQPKAAPYIDLPANISSSNCLACHQDIMKIQKIKYKNLSFSHNRHLDGYKRGFLKLECVSCHREIVIGSHIAVKDTTCFVCHFYKTPEGIPITGCPSCHGNPSDGVEFNNVTFYHTPHLKRGIKCEFCHKNIIRFYGNMTQSCVKCHTTGITNESIPDLKMHIVHVDGFKIDCVSCHEKPEHKPEVDERKCNLCHTGKYSIKI